MSVRPAPERQALLAPLLRILSLWRGRVVGLATGLLVSALALVFGLALLSFSGLRLAGTAVGLLVVSAWLLRCLGIGRVVLRYAERLLTHGATFRALADLRVWFFRRLAASAAGGLGFRRTGDALSRLVGDVDALDGLYLRLLLPLTGSVICLVVLAAMVGRQRPVLAVVICLLFATSAFLLPWIAARRSAEAGGRLSTATAGLRIAVLDLVSGLREIRAFGAAARAVTPVETSEAVLFKQQLALAGRGAVASAAAFLCGQAAVACMLAAAIGAAFIKVPPLAAVLLLFLILTSFESAAGLVRAGVLAGTMANSASRVLETGAQRRGRGDPGVAMPVDLTVRFEAVRFRWQADRIPVFDDLSLQVPPGARIALLGASGSGKSTLAALLLRVATPQSGVVSIGGVDLARLDEAALRKEIAWLGQESHLFDDSIRNNLLLGRPGASDEELWTALEQAQLADVVRSLPDGLETWLGEQATKFSGGQGRRLALARVLLSQARLLILDEPCAGLDADTEREFLKTLNHLGDGAAAAGRSMILIVHRLTGVEQLDRVWRLRAGRISLAA